MGSEVLRVQGLTVYYHTPDGPVRAVDGVTFDLKESERFGLVGESGSGKSTTAMALMGLIKPPGRIEAGQVLLNGVNVLGLPEDELRKIRLAEISLIPQGAMNSLNPVMRIEHQIVDAIEAHDGRLARPALRSRVRELLGTVGLGAAVAGMFPHELSGGMKQRVCIALAVSLRPKVIIADEPTSALDVVVQRQVMNTLERVQEQLGSAVILAGHDIGLMAQFVDRLGVMYAGKLVEVGSVKDVIKDPLHPYTRLLISSLPSIDEQGVFRGIPGMAPSLLHLPPGCAFHPRCPRVMDHCSAAPPQLREIRSGRWVACYLY